MDLDYWRPIITRDAVGLKKKLPAGHWIEIEDLIQAGYEGLLKGQSHGDAALIRVIIRHAMVDELRRGGLFSRSSYASGASHPITIGLGLDDDSEEQQSDGINDDAVSIVLSLEKMSETRASILVSRFVFGEEIEAIGGRLGISGSRVSQISLGE
ncbi:MAG: hypothetical protein L0220_26285 [Acidobacteria bacterium]|nr:hypothetical protein [Acidobacteriota bacterium]